MEVGAEGEEATFDPRAFDVVVGVVPLGEVDEGPGKNPQNEREQFIQGNHFELNY